MITTYRTDDLLYGRACFIPATMIPWTHAKNATITTQRRNRLAAQHFLFANGYQRDWYGFDYGAVIASFDGVSWFAVGNQRRIKATGNRLYLAVNTYFGDQTQDSIFTISEAKPISPSGPAHKLPRRPNDGANVASITNVQQTATVSPNWVGNTCECGIDQNHLPFRRQWRRNTK